MGLNSPGTTGSSLTFVTGRGHLHTRCHYGQVPQRLRHYYRKDIGSSPKNPVPVLVTRGTGPGHTTHCNVRVSFPWFHQAAGLGFRCLKTGLRVAYSHWRLNFLLFTDRVRLEWPAPSPLGYEPMNLAYRNGKIQGLITSGTRVFLVCR